MEIDKEAQTGCYCDDDIIFLGKYWKDVPLEINGKRSYPFYLKRNRDVCKYFIK